MIKTIILCSDKSKYTFKFIKLQNCEIMNVYKNKNSCFLIKIFRKLFYLLGIKNNPFYNDWVKNINDNVQLIVFDECKPYKGLANKLKEFKIKPIIYFWNPINQDDKIEFLKKNFNVYSYSKNDCKIYGLRFNQTFIPKIEFENKNIIYDAIFVGQNKNRLDLLEKLYKLFDNPYFYVIKDSNETSNVFKLKNKNDIIKYDDYIKLVNQSNCIIEVLPTVNAGITLRTAEAVVYDKKLITNNKNIVRESFYDKNKIYVIDSNFSIADLKQFISNSSKIKYSNKEKRIFFIETWLNNFNIL